MMARIRGQTEKLPELKANAEFAVSATAVPLPELSGANSLEPMSLDKQVAAVADRVTEMVRAAVATPHINTPSA